MLPCLLGFAQAEVADQTVELADAQDIGRTWGLCLCQVAVEGLGDGSLRDESCRTKHQLVAQLCLMFSHQMGCGVGVARSRAEFLDDDLLLAESD